MVVSLRSLETPHLSSDIWERHQYVTGDTRTILEALMKHISLVLERHDEIIIVLRGGLIT